MLVCMDATNTAGSLPELLKCESCEGRQLVCPLTDSTTCRHSRRCPAEHCSACDGLGFVECTLCKDGTPADLHTGLAGEPALCADCWRRETVASEVIGAERPAHVTAAGAKAWGEVVAAAEFGDLPTEPEIQIPASWLVWDGGERDEEIPPPVKTTINDMRETAILAAIGGE